jgi:hypothetical protein
MCLTNKIVIGLILLASPVFVYFAARAVKTQQVWRENAIAYEKAIAREKHTIEETTNGKADGTPGIRQVRLAVDKYLNRRGRAWFHAKREKADGERVSVSTELAPPKDSKNMHLFAFEESEDGSGSYLGQFTVVGAAGKAWEIEPTYKMTPGEGALYRQSSKTWTLFETMPAEDPELNADVALAAEQAKQVGLKPRPEPLPPLVRKNTLVELKADEIKPQTAEEKAQLAAMWKQTLLKHARTEDAKATIGKMTEQALAEAGEKALQKTADRVAKEVNQLDDYEQSFNGWHGRRAVMEDLFASDDHDLETMKAAVADAEAVSIAARKFVEECQAARTRALRQRQVVIEHCQALEQTCEAMERDSEELALKTRKDAAELARIQAMMLRIIDERTKKMAGSGKGVGA